MSSPEKPRFPASGVEETAPEAPEYRDKKSMQKREIISRLQKAIASASGEPVPGTPGAIPCEPLGRLFTRGLPRAALIECLYRGCGCGTLALWMARAASFDGRAIVIIDRARRFYAPPAARMGINPEQLIVVQPENKTDEIWALDQSIRCRAVAAVLWRGGKLGVRHIRRLQLACENNESLGLLLRPDALRGKLAAPAIRLLVETVHPEENLSATSATAIEHSPFSRVRLRVARLRDNPFLTDHSVELEIDDETGTLFEALPLPLVSRGTPGATKRE